MFPKISCRTFIYSSRVIRLLSILFWMIHPDCSRRIHLVFTIYWSLPFFIEMTFKGWKKGFIFNIYLSTMRLNKTEREEFRRRVKSLIPQREKSEIVNHFKLESYPRKTINRLQLGGTINDIKNGCLTSWTLTRKNQLKILARIT